VMARTVNNPVTGHQVTFLQTANETGGDLLQIEYMVPSHEEPFQYIPMHLHSIVQERFEVLSGSLGVALDSKSNRRVLSQGEEVVIEPGTSHAFWNAGPDELRFLTDIRPAWKLQTYWETAFGLASDGKVNQQGVPSLLQVAVLSSVMDTYVPGAPVGLQKVLLAPLAMFGRLLGLKAEYPRYSEGS